MGTWIGRCGRYVMLGMWICLAVGGCEWREMGSEDTSIVQKQEVAQDRPATDSDTVMAMPVTTAPTVDGKDTEGEWTNAPATEIALDGYSGDRLSMKAMYNDRDIFFLIAWPDYSHSIRQAGSWERVHVGAQFGKAATEAQDKWERFGDEDALSLIWNLDATDFNNPDVLKRVHLPNAKAQAGKMDRWHWAAGSTGPVRLLRDQYLDANGSHDDSGASFTIPNFTDQDDPATPLNEALYPVYMPRTDLTQRKIPKIFVMRGEKPILLYYRSEVTAFDLSMIDRGAKLPGYIFSEEASGSIIDVTAVSSHDAESESWTLELQRPRVTDTPQEDIQFRDLNQAYAFAIGVFDNTQVDGGRVGQKGVVTKSVTNQEIERNAGVE